MSLDNKPSNEAEIRHQIWRNLQRATQDRNHEWRTPVLATVDVQGSPQARTVVLRHADSKLGVLQIYTDSRSPKVAELRATPAAFVVFWSKRLSWQLRVQALASVQQDGPDVDAVWGRVSQSAAAGDYLSVRAPGDILLSEGPQTRSDAASEVEQKQAHQLAIITLQVQTMDWLELARTGHRRAVISADAWQWRVP